MVNADIPHLLALHAIPYMGSRTLCALLKRYRDPVLTWESYREWSSLPIFRREFPATLISGRETIEPEEIYEKFLASGARLTTVFDEDFPKKLKNICDPPVILFYKGDISIVQGICVAMIGSRRSTAYGTAVGEMLSQEVAAKGICVVSGMARGIDTVCHDGAMKAGGKTVAVLGSGVDVIYPRENAKIYQRICEAGAVISEQPLGAPPEAKNFPMRNRIISGLSEGIVVIEAGENSGTLITAGYAADQNRDLFAIPGPIISANSKGTNELIRQGCKIVTSARDIWSEYIKETTSALPLLKTDPHANLSEEERDLLRLLILPVHFDQLVAHLGINAAQLATRLTIWEMDGIVKQLPGKYYVSNINQ